MCTKFTVVNQDKINKKNCGIKKFYKVQIVWIIIVKTARKLSVLGILVRKNIHGWYVNMDQLKMATEQI